MEDYVIAFIRRSIGRTQRIALTGALLLASLALVPSVASATPSTTYWAPSTATCQPAGVPHITYDTYYGKVGGYPIDTGLTIGLIPSSKIQAEVGYDLLLPTAPINFFLNAKLCIPENAMGKGAPAIGGGFYNVGFKKGITDFNIAYGMIQKSFPFGGYIAGGVYHGMSDALFTNSDGKIVKTGALIGWMSPDIKVNRKGLSKFVLTADMQTGKNIAGAGGFGLYTYFNDYIDVLIGPVFFTDKKLQPGGKSWLWTTQVDVDIPLGKNK